MKNPTVEITAIMSIDIKEFIFNIVTKIGNNYSKQTNSIKWWCLKYNE